MFSHIIYTFWTVLDFTTITFLFYEFLHFVFCQQMKPGAMGIKALVPSSIVGAIIGKGGEEMKRIKTESGCYVRLSQVCSFKKEMSFLFLKTFKTCLKDS